MENAFQVTKHILIAESVMTFAYLLIGLIFHPIVRINISNLDKMNHYQETKMLSIKNTNKLILNFKKN